MSFVDEKDASKVRHVTIEHDAHHRIVKEAQVASVALTAAITAQKPSLWSKNMIKLYLVMSVGYLVSTMNGFDGSLMGGINAMKSYQHSFGLSGAGSSTGIIFIIYNLAQIAAAPFWYAVWCCSFRRTMLTSAAVVCLQMGMDVACAFSLDVWLS